ncbi:MAG: rRNA pseudouridine synthase [Petroclostridium sp.]|jgi:23S rRNA pseudouridine955/2504/2580 synthase|nr:rRNA pseudouridine synthase [Petroclostridium sp.]
MITITVPQDYHQKKLDRFLKDKFPNLPMSAIYKALRKKDIRINGVKINENILLQTGDQLTIYIKDEILYGSFAGEDRSKGPIPIQIVYEDQHLLLVNKQPGISVHPDKNEGEDTLIDVATRYLQQKGEYKPEKPGSFAPALCHRLDHYTGGIVIIAKTPEALKIMLEKIKNREIKKYYQCIVKGCPSPRQGELRHFLVKNEHKSQVYITDIPIKGSLTIITRYKVLSAGQDISRVEVELVTGRTHQIRAHMAYIGHPILGDDKYGDRQFNRQFKAKYQALWAYKIVFAFEDGGILNYLKGRTFETNDIKFNYKI